MERLERRMYGAKDGVYMAGEDCSGLLPDEVRSTIEEMALKYQKLPREPAIDKENGEIIPEESGYIIDVERSISRVFDASKNEKLKISKITIRPEYSSSDLKAAKKSLAYYESWISGRQERLVNINLAAAAINNTLLWPDKSFSFNEVVGPRTPERGYLPAPVILLGGNGLDYGGGICQVASTLYNAAEQAGLEIIEHHSHSKPVYYVPEGKDATVNYDDLDLKFSNNMQGPLIIKSAVNGSRIWVEIMGEEEKSE
jgi:vancomycin resistance protein YoaR